MKSLTFGSLFAGIGGMDLGLERAGMVCKWQVEVNPYARRVLQKHWPNVRKHDDVKTFPGATGWAADECAVDIIAGGFPCQDISYAGRGAGLDGERSGLFFEAVRVVRQLRPGVVVLENVAALLTRGLDRVLGTLAEIGYDAEWHCIPAAAVGAPHIRDRVFIIGAISDTERERFRTGGEGGIAGPGERKEDEAVLADSNEPVASKGRLQRSRQFMWAGCDKTTDSRRGLESNWIAEPSVGRVAHGVPARVDRLRGLGNAVVPQVAEWIGRAIVTACGGPGVNRQ